MRTASIALVLMVGCSRELPLKLELPADTTAAPVRTLIVALTQGNTVDAIAFDLAKTTPEQIAAAAPAILDWDDTPAIYTALAFTKTATALDIAQTGLAENAASPPLPTPLFTYDADVAALAPSWVKNGPLAPALGGLTFPNANGPLDCTTARVVPIRADDVRLELDKVAMTSPTTALLSGDLRGVPKLVELIDDRIEDRPLPDNVVRLHSLATDGRDVWATDNVHTLHRFDLHGRYIASSDVDIERVTVSVTGKVYGYTNRAVFAIVAGSTMTRALDLGVLPGSIDRAEVFDEHRVVLLLRDRRITVYELGRWLTPFAAEGENPFVDVAIDAVEAYAVTAAALMHREVDGATWEILPTSGTFERYGLTAFGDGRLATFGVGGLLSIHPRVLPSDDWCVTNTGTYRQIEQVSVDPTKTVLLALDDLDGDRPTEGSMMLRVTIPR